MLIASLRRSVAVAIVFSLLTATFFLLCIGNSGGRESVVGAGGWFGLARAVAA
jgi:succinate-acetate transporter protein